MTTSSSRRGRRRRDDSIPYPKGGGSGKSRRARKEGWYAIGVVSERYQLHPQTLRLYEREGLLVPKRSGGNTRLYSDEDLETLEVILNLTRHLGVNLAGVEIVLNMRRKMAEMRREIEDWLVRMQEEMRKGAPAQNSTALVRLKDIERLAAERGAGPPAPLSAGESHEKNKKDS
jgi:MerR family transcriptional regulator/heat shock protein HspR